MMKLKTLLPAIAVVAVAGCQTVVPLTNMPKQDIGKIEAADDSRFTVIITEVKADVGTHGNDVAGDMSGPARTALEATIAESGAINVNVDRTIRDQLDEELRRIEMGGSSNYKIPEAANLAINGAFDSATLTNYYYDGGDDGAPVCTYTAQVSGRVQSYSTNPIEQKVGVKLDGTNVVTSSGSCRTLSSSQQQSMYLSAMRDAIAGAKAKIKSLMATKGYVQAARMDQGKGKMYYRLSIPPASGAQPGVSVNFLETQMFEGKEETYPFAEGKIICWRGKDTVAWAELVDEGAEANIKVGTPVQLKFESGFMSSLTSGVPSLEGMVGCNP